MQRQGRSLPSAGRLGSRHMSLALGASPTNESIKAGADVTPDVAALNSMLSGYDTVSAPMMRAMSRVII